MKYTFNAWCVCPPATYNWLQECSNWGTVIIISNTIYGHGSRSKVYSTIERVFVVLQLQLPPIVSLYTNYKLTVLGRISAKNIVQLKQ